MNERLVRGLDYYNLTVFEWVTNSLGPRAPSVPVVATTAWWSSSVASRPRQWALPWAWSVWC